MTVPGRQVASISHTHLRRRLMDQKPSISDGAGGSLGPRSYGFIASVIYFPRIPLRPSSPDVPDEPRAAVTSWHGLCGTPAPSVAGLVAVEPKRPASELPLRKELLMNDLVLLRTGLKHSQDRELEALVPTRARVEQLLQ